MSRKLYELHELDEQIKSCEQAVNDRLSRLGESPALIEARNRLNSEEESLGRMKKNLHSTEADIDDLTTKLKASEEELYSGRIRNPKELSSLQQEVKAFKARLDPLEVKALGLMAEIEAAEAGLPATRARFRQVEAEWHKQQRQLSDEIEQVKARLAELGQSRQQMLKELLPEVLAQYEDLRVHKGHAVARVGQGICQSCRISLSSSQLQQARAGNIVHCNSCGRILFLP